MSKSQSNKAENNIGLISGGIIGIGCITALGVGLITLPVAIGVGAVVAVGLGAKELMNIREEKKAIDPNQARYEKASGQGFKEFNQGRGSLNEEQIEEKKATEEGKRMGKKIGEEIAREHLIQPTITTEHSAIIQEYQREAKKQNLSPQEKKDANYKLRVAQVAKELAIDFTTKKAGFSKSMLEAYKQNEEFNKYVTMDKKAIVMKKKESDQQYTIKESELYPKKLITLRENAIATSAFDEVAKVIVEHKQRPSSDPQSPVLRLGEKVRAG